MEQRLDSAPKCFGCSAPILDGDLVLRDHGDWHHVRCARILTSDKQVSESRGRQRASEAIMTRSQERLTRAARLTDESPAIVCVICLTGIGSFAELAMTGSGATHLRCRPAQSA